MGLSLWIVPNEQDAKKLEKVMFIKTNEPPLSPSSYPRFYPHITLASLPSSLEGDVSAVRAAIPQLERSLKCEFASVEIGPVYFRSVYIAIKPTKDVLDLHKRVHDGLELEPKTVVFPHMSLCYIDDDDAAKGEKAVYYDTLRIQGKCAEVEAGSETEHKEVVLNCGENGSMKSFEASEVWMVKCEGPVEGWEVLEKIPL